MKQSDQAHIIDRARCLAADAIELHVLSFRMGCGSSQKDDHLECQRIIAQADALERDIAALTAAK